MDDPAPLAARLIDKLRSSNTLPDPLPAEPFALLNSWFDQAQREARQPNPSAMALATADASGRPSVRMVLCRGLDATLGRLTFYTNYDGRKARELEATGRAAVCFHWDHVDRQVRVEGPVVRTTSAESDAYFATRPWESRVGAWASRQSEPIPSRAHLIARALEVMKELGLSVGEVAVKGDRVVIPRPANWGGYHVLADSVELWMGNSGRFHDRAAWRRKADAGTGACGPWSGTRLQP